MRPRSRTPTDDGTPRHRHGFWSRRHRRRRRAEGVAGLAARLAARLDLSEVQAAAWRPVVAALEEGAPALERLRADRAALDEAMPAPVRLARVEGALVAGLVLLHAVRRPFEAFYGTLAPDQKRTLDRLAGAARRRGRAPL